VRRRQNRQSLTSGMNTCALLILASGSGNRGRGLGVVLPLSHTHFRTTMESKVNECYGDVAPVGLLKQAGLNS
jgi:hypothetical protein